MKKQAFGFLLLLSLAGGVGAQSVKVGVVSASEQALRKHVEYLASDKLEGRRTGEAGSTAAAAYIANMFARYRLKPGGHSGNGKPAFMQPFPYVTGVEMAKSGNRFSLGTSNNEGSRTKIENMQAARPVGFSPNGSVVDAAVVFAGFGIVSAEQKFDDYKTNEAEIDVKGKVVLIFDGTPENDNPHSAFSRFDLRTRALIAKDKGASGMLVISREPTFENDKLTRLVYDQTMGEAALPMLVISRNTAAAMLGIGESDLETVEGLAASRKTAGAKVRIGFNDTRPVVSFSVDLVKKQADAYNIVGILPGTDPVLKNEAIVIGAHYDHLGRGGSGSLAANSAEIHHGADDNASGTAAVMELAREFAAEKKNKRTLIFIAFSGEEEGLLGSKHYVNKPAFPLDKTVAMINLDMVGRLKDAKLTIGGIGTATGWKDLVERSNAMMMIQSGSISDGPNGRSATTSSTPSRSQFDLQLNQDGFGPSDHSSFYGKKIPVLFLFTGTHTDYHKPTDTAEKINYDGLNQIQWFVRSLVDAIDKNPVRPTYAVAQSSMSGGRTGFNISLGTIPSYADAKDGMVLDGVRDNSPASRAGLKEGDKVVKLAGKDIRNVMDYTYVLGEMKAGEEYEVVVLRAGERLTLKIVPVKR